VDNQTQKWISDILSEVTKAVKSGDTVRISDLHSRVMGRQLRKPLKQAAKPEMQLPLDVSGDFSSFASREELEQHLEERFPSKADIAIVARSLKVPVTKADNYDALVDKIVNATVGYRLRAEAIRGRPDQRG
jgi:hypothetical protein